ncbi:hypothetical protein HMPREF2141_03187 [Bacteroides uniformis]|uniref:Uncharacterized protein n=1 Tax=Bacteroides uniformis (strain ATCC 8492 / DSM 6597 / CCUG 4942 / CIP 103695 / JCM 5828 / KCTC 5204 / NCTC 13054 / VPI 0061) TaxID=411479 RepID=A0ABC9NH99_BACUC|nr:hypothetical protein BACUNI_00175 [Bacteroides uniformis ATCC 8492]KXT32894.1 hypothetical protein HMPREF2141_03187 [Bacteroides uniformis]
MYCNLPEIAGKDWSDKADEETLSVKNRAGNRSAPDETWKKGQSFQKEAQKERIEIH